jgi:hypothetical protein
LPGKVEIQCASSYFCLTTLAATGCNYLQLSGAKAPFVAPFCTQNCTLAAGFRRHPLAFPPGTLLDARPEFGGTAQNNIHCLD